MKEDIYKGKWWYLVFLSQQTKENNKIKQHQKTKKPQIIQVNYVNYLADINSNFIIIKHTRANQNIFLIRNIFMHKVQLTYSNICFLNVYEPSQWTVIFFLGKKMLWHQRFHVRKSGIISKATLENITISKQETKQLANNEYFERLHSVKNV